MTQSEIMVIGAMGNVGTEVVKSLQSQRVVVRAADRFPDKVQQRCGAAVEPVRFDFSKPETFGPAFLGVRRVFLMRPPQISDV